MINDEDKEEYESVKIVKATGNGGHVLLPRWLIGQKVMILLEKDDF